MGVLLASMAPESSFRPKSLPALVAHVALRRHPPVQLHGGALDGRGHALVPQEEPVLVTPPCSRVCKRTLNECHESSGGELNRFYPLIKTSPPWDIARVNEEHKPI